MEEEVIRTNVYLPAKLWEAAKIRAMKDRVSFTEIVRKALALYLAEPKKLAKKKGG